MYARRSDAMRRGDEHGIDACLGVLLFLAKHRGGNAIAGHCALDKNDEIIDVRDAASFERSFFNIKDDRGSALERS
jgi:hypothetical protein